MEGICFEAEGKARVQNFQKTYSASFYEEFFSDEKTWELVIDIPFHGEEYLEIKWDGTKSLIGGSLVKKMMQGVPRKSKFSEKAKIKKFIKKFAKFSRLVNFKEKLECTHKKNIICKNNKGIEIVLKESPYSRDIFLKLEDNLFMKSSFNTMENGYFKRQKFSLVSGIESKNEHPEIKIDLFLSACHLR